MPAAVICPFCFHAHDFGDDRRCPHTTYPVPDAYLHPGEGSSPPLWLMTLGFERHGKSCFLAAMATVLEALPAWSQGSFSVLDGYTFEQLREMRERQAGGSVEPRTPAGHPRPLLLQTRDLPGVGSRCLVVYDLPGESYDAFEKVADRAPAMRAVQTVWFFVSLRSFQEDEEGRSIQELFAVYQAGMRRLGLSLRGRTLIVVFTKFDQQDRPARVRDYVDRDPLHARWRAAREAANEPPAEEEPAAAAAPIVLDGDYRSEMNDISKRLEHFTRSEVRGGPSFLNFARSEGMTVVFAAVSALGGDPDASGELPADGGPHRVLDPLLWAVQSSAPLMARRFHLVLDETGSGEEVAGVDSAALWHRLGGLGVVSTYVLGRRSPAAGVGHPPPTPVRRSGPRLVGPLLDSLPPGDRVLILTAGPILDLADFAATDWPQRTLVVTYGEGAAPGDAWQVLAEPAAGDGVELMVERFLRLA